MFKGTTRRLPGGTADPFGGSSQSVNGPENQNEKGKQRKNNLFA
jgi:hypothetical protein